MEGIGYWVILIIIYLISALAKKRQQAQRRERLDDEGEAPPGPSPASFGGGDFMRNFLKEAGLDLEEEEAVVEEEEEPAAPAVEPGPVAETPKTDRRVQEKIATIRQQIEQFDQEMDEVLETPEVPEQVKIEIPKHVNLGRRMKRILPELEDREDWRQAIIMKEILDKPRSKRRTIR